MREALGGERCELGLQTHQDVLVLRWDEREEVDGAFGLEEGFVSKRS